MIEPLSKTEAARVPVEGEDLVSSLGVAVMCDAPWRRGCHTEPEDCTLRMVSLPRTSLAVATVVLVFCDRFQEDGCKIPFS